MHIGGPKRTKQLDDARPIVVCHTPEGLPVWIEAGDKAMSGDQKAELANNLRAQRRHQSVLQAVKDIHNTAAAFLEASILELAPQEVLADYKSLTTNQGGGSLFEDWFTKAGFGFRQDGLKSLFLRKGQVLREIVAKVDPRLEADVIQMLSFESIVTKAERPLPNQ